jgi:hypothetical protein
VIDLSRTCDNTVILICNALVMFMIYPWVKIKLKVLIFPTIPSYLKCLLHADQSCSLEAAHPSPVATGSSFLRVDFTSKTVLEPNRPWERARFGGSWATTSGRVRTTPAG